MHIGNYDEAGDPSVVSWEKVTRKVVDPITFSCNVNVSYVPHIEDCSGDTIHQVHTQPRLAVKKVSSKKNGRYDYYGGNNSFMMSQNNMSFNNSFINNTDSSTGYGQLNSSYYYESNNSGVSTPNVSNRKSAAAKPKKSIMKPEKITKKSSSNKKQTASLGLFFQQENELASQDGDGDNDNHSLSSKSMNSRSVADRSKSERSKSEESLKKRLKSRSSSKGHDDDDNSTYVSDVSASISQHMSFRGDVSMVSIDEGSIADFSRTSGSNRGLSNFLTNVTNTVDENDDIDMKSTMSGSTVGSRSKAERSKKEIELKEFQDSITDIIDEDSVTDFFEKLKKQRSERELKEKEQEEQQAQKAEEETNPASDDDDDDDANSLTVEDVEKETKIIEKNLRFKEGHDMMEIPRLTNSMYDDLFWASDELAEFRYEAFLEEAGLDKDEFD